MVATLRRFAFQFAVLLCLVTPASVATAQDVSVRTTRNTPLRREANGTGAVLRALEAGSRLELLAGRVQNGFLRVDVSGTLGYVAAADVSWTIEPPIQNSPLRLDTVVMYRVQFDTVRMPARMDTVFRQPEPRMVPLNPPLIDPAPSTSFRIFPLGSFTAILTEEMAYKIGSTSQQIVVPAGFVTDFASIPRPLWSVLPPTGDYKLAAVVHDYLYWEQPCTQEQSDNLFYIAMVEQGVPFLTRSMVYGGVRSAGHIAWGANRAAKAARVPRHLSASLVRPGNVSWDSYRQQIMAQGVRGDSSHTRPAPAYCALGNSTDVPGAGSDRKEDRQNPSSLPNAIR